MPEFVHLHNHSQYSLLDGIATFEDIVRRLHDTGMGAFALTDHGNLYGAVEFFDRMSAAGLHPIIGCEVYVAQRGCMGGEGDADRTSRQLVLLAGSQDGYRNLVKLVSLGFTQGYYYRPRIDFELLSAHKEGLIALSACLHGVVNAPLLQEGEARAEEEVERYAKLLGEERFFLELQNHGLPEEERAREFLRDQSRRHGLPLVATNDCHYVYPEDASAHDIALCLQTRVKQADEDRMRFSGPHYYLRNQKEMAELFAEDPEALANTARIAGRCQVELRDRVVHFPAFSLPEEQAKMSPEEFLRSLAFEGAERRYGEPVPEQVRARLEEELSVISSTGFTALFLVVWDLLRHARQEDIPAGPGRGSAAGSLVSYCLFITKLDPLQHGLFFERFLNKERVELPDFDLDFCYERREEIIDYIRRRYGEENVAQIITFSTLKARAVIKAVGRVKDYEFAYVDRITKRIQGLNLTIRQAVEQSPELAEMLERDPAARELVQEAEKLEGLVSHVSVHAAGVVIADRPLIDYVPLRTVKDTPMLVTQYEMGSLEKVGLFKFDVLGLKTLTTIDKCVRYVREIEGKEIDVDAIPLDEGEVFEEIYSKGDTFGVFQFEAPHIVRVMKETHPTSIEDLTALNALNRPGPMQGGMFDIYIRNTAHPEKARPPAPELEPILAPTSGVLLYQEQVMLIARELAGYTLGEADILRKAMGKKRRELMTKQREEFAARAEEHGTSKRKAGEIWKMMENFAGYGFNKAHSACYAYLSYQTAYLKRHFPQYFIAALMNTYISDPGKLAEALADAARQGIEVTPPRINRSAFDFTPTAKREIVFGLGGIKHLGRAAVDEIVNERGRGGAFESVEDFLGRVGSRAVTKTSLDYLIRAGAFDEFGHDRGELLTNLDGYLARRVHRNQIDIFSDASTPTVISHRQSTPQEIAQMELQSIGVFLTHNPYEQAFVLRDPRVNQIEQLLRELEESGLQLADKKMELGGVLDRVSIRISQRKQRYALAKLCSVSASLTLVVGPSALQRHQNLLVDGNEALVRGVVNLDDAQSEEFEDLRESLKMYVDSVTLYRGDGGKGERAARAATAVQVPGVRRAAAASVPSCLLLKFSRPPTKEALSALREAAAEMRGSTPTFLFLPVPEGRPKKLYLGDDFLLDADRARELEREFSLRVVPVFPPPRNHRL